MFVNKYYNFINRLILMKNSGRRIVLLIGKNYKNEYIELIYTLINKIFY